MNVFNWQVWPKPVCASEKLKLVVADATGAFLQGKKITRNLYFRLPKNTGDLGITGVAPGSLLKCEKAIYGTNDAARQWYLALREILESLGWEAQTFENATFQLCDKNGERISLMCFHVDDFLMGWNMRHLDVEKHMTALKNAINFGKWECIKENQSLWQILQTR